MRCSKKKKEKRNIRYRKITLLFLSLSGGPSSQLQAQEPRSSENTSTLLEDSGCGLSNDQRTEPSEMTEHSGESCISTPFPPLPIVNRPCAPLEKPLSSHMQFLQHLLGLKTLTESESLKTDLSHFENASSTVSDSVFQLLDGLITFYREPKLPCSSFWIKAVDTLARLISDCNLSNHILKKCSKKLEEFEKTLVQVILRNSHINRVSNTSFLCVKYHVSSLGEHAHWVVPVVVPWPRGSVSSWTLFCSHLEFWPSNICLGPHDPAVASDSTALFSP